ncbi:MAG: hypothetical protein JHC57_07265 [Sphingopyxis sp.]|uniref:hypothetical protein n=1 Tax=Sphingopyxis sp. TaxID=1908224 RepID=UPI001A32ED33|nr:hypothetical protein [Sphingopyxis sp.]MBJ7499536.1 hypothetical protein [Sphingopyxis sp.]
MSNDTKIANVDDLHVFAKTGTVVGQQQSTVINTTTTTSGGGGYLHQGTGHVQAPTTTVSTSSSEKLRIFFRDDNGKEIEAEFSDTPFGVREEHRVSVVYAGPAALKSGYPVALVNHSTGNDKIFLQVVDLLLPKLSGCLALGLILGTPIGFLILGALIFEGGMAGFFILGMIAGFVPVIMKLSRRKTLMNAVVDRIKAKVADVIAEEK